MINEKIFQSIFDELSQYLFENWKSLVVYLEYGVASYSFTFFVKKEDEYVNCYDIPNVSEDLIDKSFEKIDLLVREERMKNEGSLWTNMTMVISSTGDVHVDFDYSDLSEGSYQYFKEWKAKYIN